MPTTICCKVEKRWISIKSRFGEICSSKLTLSQGDLSKIFEVLINNSAQLSTWVLEFDSLEQRAGVGVGNHKFHQYETKFRDQNDTSSVGWSDEIL